MNVEQAVAQRYTRGNLAEMVNMALQAMRRDPERLAATDLGMIDTFYVDGPQEVKFFGRGFLRRGMHLLDIGSGLGGLARYLAGQMGCTVAGIDLTEECVQVANDLTRRTGLDSAVSFRQGNALDLPFAAAGFDGAYMLHVGMNIEDKARLFAEVRRALKPGGLFLIRDPMRTSDHRELLYPVPWAETSATSFVEPPADYRRRLIAAGFEVLKEGGGGELAYQLLQSLWRHSQSETSWRFAEARLWLAIAMGSDYPATAPNMLENLNYVISSIEITSRVSGP